MIDMFTGATFDEYKKYLLKSVLTNNQKVKKLYNLIDLEEITVESVLSDSLLSERDFVELIAARRRLGYDPTVGGGNKAAEDETDRLYAKNPWKFVEEFLQNADDCNYDSTPIIDIIVDEGNSTIEFAYNEKGFSRRDIWAIAAFSQSTKTDDIIENQEEEGIFYKEKTGRKGKGFKSVFSLNADNVIVHIKAKKAWDSDLVRIADLEKEREDASAEKRKIDDLLNENAASAALQEQKKLLDEKLKGIKDEQDKLYKKRVQFAVRSATLIKFYPKIVVALKLIEEKGEAGDYSVYLTRKQLEAILKEATNHDTNCPVCGSGLQMKQMLYIQKIISRQTVDDDMAMTLSRLKEDLINAKKDIVAFREVNHEYSLKEIELLLR